MAILNIITEDNPTLRKTSRKVEDINSRILTLLDDMRDTLIKANGAGLAAVQVGVLRRIVLVCYEEDNIIELINPEIIDRKGTQQELEGCLSLPDRWGLVERPETVTVKALDRNGKEFTVTASGLGARAFCHELDHLDGILYTDKAIKMLTPEELDELYS